MPADSSPPAVGDIPNTTHDAKTWHATIAAISLRRCWRQRCVDGRLHRSINGVTTSAPTASPSHQVNQISLASPVDARPAITSVNTPMLAAIVVALMTASANRTMSGVRSNAAMPFA